MEWFNQLEWWEKLLLFAGVLGVLFILVVLMLFTSLRLAASRGQRTGIATIESVRENDEGYLVMTLRVPEGSMICFQQSDDEQWEGRTFLTEYDVDDGGGLTFLQFLHEVEEASV